ncbi:MAG: hypothetical protein K0U34_08560 [Alphaproteobacteria bacterium]|nr:hypothetical protein [Alphaproteobacteria bacterium]
MSKGSPADDKKDDDPNIGGEKTSGPTQLVLNLPHRQALGAEDFFVSTSNASAVDLIDTWPDWPHSAAVVVGPQGCGKSHLAHVWQLRSGAHVLSSADLNEANIPQPGARQAVVVEDVDTNLADERALFHILNLARETQFSVLITARRAPGELEISLPDLRSRIRALPVVEISMPDQPLLKAVLIKLFGDRQLPIEPHVVNYLATRMERSMEAASRVVQAVDDLALARQRRITRAVAAEALTSLGMDED